MNYQEFEDMVMENILTYLPEEYQGSNVTIRDICKLGENYRGLSIIKPGANTSPVADMNALYEEYRYHMADKDFVLAEIADLFKKPVPYFALEEFTDYESIKKRLYIRVSNSKNEALVNAPHRIVEDLAITYHAEMSIRTDGIKSSVMVNNIMAKEYGVTELQLYQDAIENSAKINPSYISTLAEELGLSEGDSPSIYLITTKDKVYGAAAIMYPSVLDELFLKVNGPYYILPSSVHEVLAIPDDGMQDPDVLQQMVETVNQTEVAPGERLSNNVYYYDGRSFSKCANASERRQAYV